MITICIRTFILYLVVLFTLRVMGKSELSKTSTFQMVVLFMIAELASMPIDSPSSSLINGVIAIFTLLFLQVLLSIFSMKSEWFKNFINGTPSLIIQDGMVNAKEMKRLRITINELLEQLRIEDCPSIADVKYAIMEPNGQLSIIQTNQQSKLPITLISDGTIYPTNFKKTGLEYDTFLQILSERGISYTKEVFIDFYDTDQKLHIFQTPSKGNPFSKEVF